MVELGKILGILEISNKSLKIGKGNENIREKLKKHDRSLKTIGKSNENERKLLKIKKKIVKVYNFNEV